LLVFTIFLLIKCDLVIQPINIKTKTKVSQSILFHPFIPFLKSNNEIRSKQPTVNIFNNEVIETPTAIIEVRFTINEGVHGTNNELPLRFTVGKESTLELDYDSTMTSIAGRETNNADWEFDDTSDPGNYIFTYKKNGSYTFPEFSDSYVGVKFKFTAPASQKGDVTIKASVQGTDVHDIQSRNDADESTFEFVNP